MKYTLTRHIFLTGFMGSGKSTIGKSLAKQLGVPFIDTDHQIEEALGVEIKDIFRDKGEDWFRVFERETLEKISLTNAPAVISLGGGTLMNKQSLQVVRGAGTLIYIKSSPSEIWKRIRHSTRRPLMRKDGEEWSREKYLGRIAELMQLRESGYAEADITIDRDGKEITEISELIINQLNSAQ